MVHVILQGIEKKTAKLQGSEKAVVARHEVGHAVVGTAISNLLSGQSRVEIQEHLSADSVVVNDAYGDGRHVRRGFVLII
ncbi:FTSH protease 9 [Perilla frutescens var. hirtella]|nr:FTSH protease 9 [Perilla frutescens var. frutescens]KAH6787974.1 FTSH protease 9 [Perilla frutescens var. hirtella]